MTDSEVTKGGTKSLKHVLKWLLDSVARSISLTITES